MHCPFFFFLDTKVIDTRLISEGEHVKRRRQCLSCHERFTTIEKPELIMPNVIKHDGSREPFNEDKLRKGMKHALEKRPVSTEEFENAVNRILSKMRGTCEREVISSYIGQCVMEELRELDPVAYIRFSSVYSSFDDIQDFATAIERFIQSEEERKKAKAEGVEVEKKKEEPKTPTYRL